MASFWDMLTSQTKVAGSPLPVVGSSSPSPLGAVRSSRAQPKYLNEKEHKTCLFINTCVVKLEMDLTIRSTACWLFHRFAKTVNLDDYDEYDRKEGGDLAHGKPAKMNQVVAMTCIFLSGKLDENHIKMRDVINVAYRTLYPDQPVLQLDATYSSLVDTLIDFELFLCRTLKFDLLADRPHNYLLHYLKSLSDWMNHEDLEKPFAQMAWNLLNDCFLTSMCVEVKPELLAVSCCYLALKIYDIKLEYEEYCGKVWWKIFIEDIKLETIEELAVQILLVYEYGEKST